MSAPDGDWWRSAFGADYLAVYAHRDDASAAAEVAGLLPRLRAAPGPVLDACCGAGRHTQALRAAGLDAVGFDWSADLLRQAAGRPQVVGRVARGDVRAPPLAGGFGAVLLLFTAFGYFDEPQDQGCLAALAGLLAGGGWLVLDLPDPGRVRAGLVPTSRRTLADGTEVGERRWLEGDLVCKEITIRRGGREHRLHERVRLYRDGQVESLARGAGLDAIEAWRSLHGPDHDAGRRVWWLRRP